MLGRTCALLGGEQSNHMLCWCLGPADLTAVLRSFQVQEGSSAEHIRNLWRLHHEHHSYTEYTQEWATCLLLIACPCPAPKLKGNGSAASSSTSSGGNSSASAQTIALV